MTPVVHSRGLSASYDGKAIIREIPFELPGGEWLGLVGPNGAGKTTVLRALSGSVPIRGELEILGTPIALLSRRSLARSVAVVPQNPVVPAGMTVLDYVILGRAPYIRYWSSETSDDVAVVQRWLERLELDGLADRELGTLSGGERQRAIMARALAQGAPILLLDEPTASLDVGHQQSVLEMLDRLRHQQGITVLSAMHDLTLVGQYADRLLLLSEGEIAAEGDPKTVLDPGSIARHYGAEVTVTEGPDGLAVIPRRPSPSQSDA